MVLLHQASFLSVELSALDVTMTYLLGSDFIDIILDLIFDALDLPFELIKSSIKLI